MNTITVELSATDRELLNNLLEAIKGQQNCTQCAQISNAYAQELKELHCEAKEEPKPEPVAEPEPVEEPTPEEVVAEEEPITHIEVQKLVRELSKTRFFDDARDIVKSYAECVSDIPEEKLAEAYAKLIALG